MIKSTSYASLSDDFAKTPFFNPPSSLMTIESPTSSDGIAASTLDLTSLEGELQPKRRLGGTLSRLKNRPRSISELPRPTWDAFKTGNDHLEFDPAMNNSYETIDENGPPKSLAKLFENTSIAETSEKDDSSGSIDSTILSLASAATQDSNAAKSPFGSAEMLKEYKEKDKDDESSMGTWKKIAYRSIRKKSLKSTMNHPDETLNLVHILNEQRVPDSIETKVEGGRKLVMEGTVEDLCKVLGMQTEIQSDYVDVFLATFRYFTTPDNVLDELMRTHRDNCIDLTTEEALALGQNTVVEWNEVVEKHILNVIAKWYSHYYQDFVDDFELDLKLRDFLQSDIFELNTKLYLPTLIEKLDKVGENYQGWLRETKLMVQYRTAVERNGVDVMRKTSTKTIFDLNIVAAVKALCQLEMELYQRIPAWEFSSLSWMSKNCEEAAPNIYEHICMFNKISDWVATEVVLTRNIDMRANLIERFITMARQAREWNNFNTCFQIVLGLHNPAVLKLKSTWSKVGRKYMTALSEVNQLVNPDKNHKFYRQELAKTVPPCVPYVGMFMKDLFFAMEGSPTTLANGNVNFGKLNTVGMTILAIRRFQSTGYPFKDETLIHWFRLHTFALGEEELLAHSRKLLESQEV